MTDLAIFGGNRASQPRSACCLPVNNRCALTAVNQHSVGTLGRRGRPGSSLSVEDYPMPHECDQAGKVRKKQPNRAVSVRFESGPGRNYAFRQGNLDVRKLLSPAAIARTGFGPTSPAISWKDQQNCGLRPPGFLRPRPNPVGGPGAQLQNSLLDPQIPCQGAERWRRVYWIGLDPAWSCCPPGGGAHPVDWPS